MQQSHSKSYQTSLSQGLDNASKRSYTTSPAKSTETWAQRKDIHMGKKMLHIDTVATHQYQ
jgi:hypothetical protein